MEDKNFKEQLLARIDEVLYYLWDPIGVSDTPEVRDEYGSYVDSIWRAVLEGKSKGEISEILTKITSEQMGLEPRKEHDDEVAKILLGWARLLKRYHE